MPSLKLVYFPVRAKAEMIRMALAYGKVPYEDLLPANFFHKSWSEGAKAEAPFGGLPILVVDGEPLAQSGSIMRYVAQLSGLMPADPFTSAKCDAVFEAAQELMTGATNVNPIVNVFKGDTFAEKKAVYFEAFPGKLANLARALGDGPFFFGASPLYCDLAVYHAFSNTQLLEPTALDGYPNVSIFMNAVADLPGISEYLGTRPDPVDIGVAPMLRTRSGL